MSCRSLEGYITTKLLVATLKLAGLSPTRESPVAALHRATLDINDLFVVCKTNYQGMSFVELLLVICVSKSDTGPAPNVSGRAVVPTQPTVQRLGQQQHRRQSCDMKSGHDGHTELQHLGGDRHFGNAAR